MLKHGHAIGKKKSAELQAWSDMKGRCNNPTYKAYSRYGGRGIKVCEQWINSFETFIADVGLRPSPKHSLNRIDNDGNYEPANVSWAMDDFEQMNNTRRNKTVIIDGEVLTYSQASRKYGIHRHTIRDRANRGLTGRELL